MEMSYDPPSDNNFEYGHEQMNKVKVVSSLFIEIIMNF